MKLEHLILGVLIEHPSTGYDLKKYFDTSGRFLRSNTQMSQVYRALTGMEERGWITHSVEERPGAQDAKTYRVTEDGTVVFLDWLTGPYQPPSRFEDPEFTARLGFAGLMSIEDILRLLDTELEARRAQIARFRFRDRSEEWNPAIPFDEDLAAQIAQRLHERGTSAVDAHVAWVEALRAELLDRVPPVGSSDATAVPSSDEAAR